ncbi:hypothetical protein CFE70_002739 [Pyrenophora teres f. teres 0-1]
MLIKVTESRRFWGGRSSSKCLRYRYWARCEAQGEDACNKQGAHPVTPSATSHVFPIVIVREQTARRSKPIECSQAQTEAEDAGPKSFSDRFSMMHMHIPREACGSAAWGTAPQQPPFVPRVMESGVTLLVRRPAWDTWAGKNYVSPPAVLRWTLPWLVTVVLAQGRTGKACFWSQLGAANTFATNSAMLVAATASPCAARRPVALQNSHPLRIIRTTTPPGPGLWESLRAAFNPRQGSPISGTFLFQSLFDQPAIPGLTDCGLADVGEIDPRPSNMSAALPNVACRCCRDRERHRTSDAALCSACELPLAPPIRGLVIGEATILVFSLTSLSAAASRPELPILLPPVAGLFTATQLQRKL